MSQNNMEIVRALINNPLETTRPSEKYYLFMREVVMEKTESKLVEQDLSKKNDSVAENER